MFQYWHQWNTRRDILHFRIIVTNFYFTFLSTFSACLYFFMVRPHDIMLYFDLWPEQKCHSKVMNQKEVTHSNGSNERKSCGRKLADEMGQGKAHDTLIDWCTGREWPLNCITVISAWWQLNMRFQRSSGRSSGRWTII